MIHDDFQPRPHPRWRRLQIGGGRMFLSTSGLRLLTVGASRQQYADAQLDDYSGARRRAFPWRPPLRLTVRAKASGALRGTAGFGFWNNPFSPLGGWPALPAALWFFHASPPSDMPLALGTPGNGWKCASLDATTPAALAWAPLAPLVVLLNQHPRLQQRVWPLVERSLRIAEAPMPALDDTWRTYTLEWRTDGATFAADGQVLLHTERVPRGPLGFVAWVDNQWAVATPRGRFGWGLLDAAEPQWIDFASIRVEKL